MNAIIIIINTISLFSVITSSISVIVIASIMSIVIILNTAGGPLVDERRPLAAHPRHRGVAPRKLLADSSL